MPMLKQAVGGFLEKRWPRVYKAVVVPKRKLQWFLIWRRAGLSLTDETVACRCLRRASDFKQLMIPDRDAVKYVGTNPGEGTAQLAMLMYHGCKPGDTVFELGCGALIAGYPIMQYLDTGKYFGIEPNKWLVEDSLRIPQVKDIVSQKKPRFAYNADFDGSELKTKFDYIFGHSIFSHAAHWQWPLFLKNIEASVKPGSKILVSLHFTEGNKYGDVGYKGTELDFNEWVYPGISFFRKETIKNLAEKYGYDFKIDLVAPMLINTAHPGANHSWILLEKK
ncbi:MAG: class I SAM-dependent methyltransferase [bacterium]|nr:class I SAM-dependent methyltransferase [bacterium]